MARFYENVDFSQLVEDFHSGNPIKREKALSTALKALKGFIISVMKRYYPTYISREFDDLLQSSYLAIIKEFENYNPDISMPSTFFFKPIKQAMQLHLNMQENQSSVYYRTMNNKIQAVVKPLEEHGISLNDDDVACMTGLSKKTVTKARDIHNGSQKFSFDERFDIEKYATASPEKAIEKAQELQAFYSYLESVLTITEKTFVYEYFGLKGCPQLGIRDMAHKHHMSNDAVNNILNEAYQKLDNEDFQNIFDNPFIIKPQTSVFEDCEI